MSKELDELVTIAPYQFGGSLMGKLRGIVHAIAGKWAMADLVSQQNLVNGWLKDRLLENGQWQQSQEAELIQLRKQVAELSQQVVQLQRGDE